MAKVPVTAEKLGDLGDGYAHKATERALEEINKDLFDRGHDGKPRKLTLTYTFKPTDDGQRVTISMTAKTALPAFQPPETVAKRDKAAGGFMFNPEVSANPDQLTLSDADDGRDE